MQSAALNGLSFEGARSSLSRLALLALRWWLGELRAMAPPALLAYVDRARAPSAWLTMRPDGLSATLIYNQTPVVMPVGNELPASVLALARNDLMPVRLHPRLVFQTKVEFPAAAEANLAKIIEHHIGLLVPMNPEDTIFRFALTSRDHVKNAIGVEIAIVKRETLTSLQNQCRRLRIIPESLRLEESTPATNVFDFLARATPPAISQQQRRRRFLDATAIVLTLLLIGVLKWNRASQRTYVQNEIAVLEMPAGKAALLEKDLEALKRTSDYVNGKLTVISRLVILNELAMRLPDSSWLSELRITQDEITLSGNAADAAALIAALEASPILSNPHFVAPIFGWRDGTQHFDMAVQVKEPNRRR